MKKFKSISFLIIFNLFMLTPLIFFATDAASVQGNYGLVGCDGVGCDINDFFRMLQKVIEFLIKAGIAFVGITFAYAGYLYMTAQGDTSKISQAHSMFTKAAIGLVVALSAFLIVQLLLNTLKVKEGELMIQLKDKFH